MARLGGIMSEDLGFTGNDKELVRVFLRFMADTPYQKIRVRDITEACHLSRTAFYRSFEDVYDMMEQLEKRLLERLSLYRCAPCRRGADAAAGQYAGAASERAADGVEEGVQLAQPVGRPFESIENWFREIIRLRPLIAPVIGPCGDPYFKERLSAQLRVELNEMMDDDRAPKDRLRPYYVAQQAASYLGLMSYVVSVPSERDLISVREMANIANVARTAYYRCTEGAPTMSDERLFGA